MLKVIRMDPERIRNVMSEVMGLWPRVEPLRGGEVSDLPLQCPKESTALCQAGCCAKGSQGSHRTAQSSSKSTTQPRPWPNPLFIERRARNYAENIMIPANSKGTDF